MAATVSLRKIRTRSLVMMLLVCSLAGLATGRREARAQQPEAAATGGFSKVETDWGGYLRAIATSSRVDDDTVYPYFDAGPHNDGQLEWRLKNQSFIGSRWTLETHYELVALGGDTLEALQALETTPAAVRGLPSAALAVGDDRRLMSLTRVLIDEDRHLVYHRLDRLNLTYAPDWGTLRLGRQALTWGDGMVFNPMDLFNPFSPTAVQRDYKTGDDMALIQLPLGEAELQMIALPRRDPETGGLEEKASSWAGKLHTPVGSAEMDFMAARHYDDWIAGAGATGYLSEAAWRVNAVYTRLNDDSRRQDFFEVVANLDYAWMWGGKNVYGLAEFYANGLGLTGDYEDALTDPALLDRLDRGERFTLGRYYLAGNLQVECHPLVQLQATAIVNLADPSGLLQPQLQWDITNNLQAIAGCQWHWGGDGSEYGGYDVTAGDAIVRIAPADRLYLWLTYYY